VYHDQGFSFVSNSWFKSFASPRLKHKTGYRLCFSAMKNGELLENVCRRKSLTIKHAFILQGEEAVLLNLLANMVSENITHGLTFIV
jgi:hypothetical protein